jgi:hypothetical protein
MRIGESPCRASSLNATHFRNRDDCDPAAAISATRKKTTGLSRHGWQFTLAEFTVAPIMIALLLHGSKVKPRITFYRGNCFPKFNVRDVHQPRRRRVSTLSLESKVIGWK